jgi:subtilisin family serine protease
MMRPKVVVIDSGIDPEHPGLRGKSSVIAGPRFDRQGIAEEAGGGIDDLGHGSAVAATIASFVSNIEFVSLRVFDREATCDFLAVLHALEHAVGLGIPMINVSLGTTSLRYRKQLESIAQRGRELGVRIVAPASYAGLPCDPGNLKTVEAVVADANVLPQMPEMRTHGSRLVWFASPLPPRDASGGRKLIARGDSLAVASVTGCLLRAAQS